MPRKRSSRSKIKPYAEAETKASPPTVPLGSTNGTHAPLKGEEGPQPVAVSFGSAFAPLEQRQAELAVEQAQSLAPDLLVNALEVLDVHFLRGGQTTPDPVNLTSRELFAELACASEARLRVAIIPLLLRHPELAPDARDASTDLTALPLGTLQCFYTAAFLLQRKYTERLVRLLGAQPELPDLFSAELELTLAPEVDISLQHLLAKHATLSGSSVNWAGTYEHAAERLIKQLENQARWAQRRAA